MADFQFSQSVNAQGLSITAGGTYSASLALSLSDIAAPSATTLMNIAFKVANVKAIAILSDVALVLKTNSSGSPANTITIPAGIPYIWTTDSFAALLLTSDVTAFYFVNATANPANVKCVVVTDATP